MIDGRRETQASLYVLGTLPVAEQREFEQAMLANLELQLLVRDLQAATPKNRLSSSANAAVLPAIPPLAEASDTSADGSSASGTDWLPWVPWILAASFTLLSLVLLSFGSGLRKENDDLAQQLAEAQSAYADLQTQQTNLQRKLIRVETNYVTRIADLQKQVLQKTQDYERQKVELNTRSAEATQARKQLAALQNPTTQIDAELQPLSVDLGGVNSPNQDRLAQLRTGLLTPTPDGPPAASAASVYDLAEQKGILETDNLAPLPPDRDYQLWLFDPNFPTPVSGGVFRVERGSTRIEYRAATQVTSPERFAISIERKGGSAVPQGRFILASH